MEFKNESLESLNQETSKDAETSKELFSVVSSENQASSNELSSHSESSLDENVPLPTAEDTPLPTAEDMLLQDEEERYYDEGDDECSLPPKMPEHLPSLIRLLVSRSPKIYQPTVAQAVFPSLAAHLYKVKFRYVDNVDHEATLMNVLMAPTGSGKSCINAPINHIMADIRERDKVNLQREREWRMEMSTMGTHKYKPARPKNLVIQDIDPDMTMAAFAQRSVDAKGHFLYSQMNEIDQWDSIEGVGRAHQNGLKFRIMCLAFDPGNSFGQTRISPEAVNEHFQIRYNWNACTTIGKGREYFRKVVSDGPVSRINFCTIPQREIGASIPRFGTYDEEFDKQLRPYIQHLCKVRDQRVECPDAIRLVKQLIEECCDNSILSQDRIYENFTFRALVIAYLKACVLYVANGCKWEEEMDEFIRWSLHYDLWCKMEFFWDLVKEEQEDANRIGERGPKNLLRKLPDEFTWGQVEMARIDNGMDINGTREMIKTWMKRGYLQYDRVSFKTLFRKASFVI